MLETTQNPSGRMRSDGLQPAGISDHTKGSILEMEIPTFSFAVLLSSMKEGVCVCMKVRALQT